MRLPVDGTYKTGPTGGYGADRGDVNHWGVDVRAKKGAPVYAPAKLTITDVAIDDKTPPLSGYGPGAVQGKWDNPDGPDYFMVLGHMDPSAWAATPFGENLATLPYPGRVYQEGDLIGFVAKDHVHWEMRTMRRPPKGAARGAVTVDPIAFLTTGAGWPLPEPAKAGAGWFWLLVLALAAGRKRR